MNEGAAELTRNRSGRSCGEWRDLYSITEVPETGDEMSALGTIWGALGPRVQLIDGLIRTKNRADLGADAGALLPQSSDRFIPCGSALVGGKLIGTSNPPH